MQSINYTDEGPVLLDEVLTSPEWRWGLLPSTDVFIVISSYLDSTSLTLLSGVSRLWHAMIQERYRSVHRLTFKEISCAKWLPPAEQCRSLRKLDLRLYIAISAQSTVLAASSLSLPAPDDDDGMSAGQLSYFNSASSRNDDIASDAASCESTKMGATSHQWLALFLETERSCERLRSLQLGPLVPKALAAKFLGRCSNLRAISLSGMPEVNEAVLQGVEAPLHHLRTVDLSNVKRISDAAIALLGTCFPCLEKLNLSGCRNRNIQALLSVLKTCRRLTMLELDVTTSEELLQLLHFLRMLGEDESTTTLRALKINNLMLDERSWLAFFDFIASGGKGVDVGRLTIGTDDDASSQLPDGLQSTPSSFAASRSSIAPMSPQEARKGVGKKIKMLPLHLQIFSPNGLTDEVVDAFCIRSRTPIISAARSEGGESCEPPGNDLDGPWSISTHFSGSCIATFAQQQRLLTQLRPSS